MTTERIIDRIRKLLELSHSNNEHEAATAAARAAELMGEHEISEAMLQVSKPDDEPAPYIPERIVEEGMPESERTKQRVAWRDRVLGALAYTLDLEKYINEGNYIVFGRESAVATWRYVGMYLVAEVDRLADEAWLKEGPDLAAVGQRPRVWKAAFRVGAADTIASRLYDEHRKRTEKQRTKAKELAGATGDNTGTAAEALALVRVDQALEILKKDRAEVIDRFKARGKELRLRSIGAVGNSQRRRSGYAAGLEAGHSINLKGGGKVLTGGGK